MKLKIWILLFIFFTLETTLQAASLIVGESLFSASRSLASNTLLRATPRFNGESHRNFSSLRELKTHKVLPTGLPIGNHLNLSLPLCSVPSVRKLHVNNSKTDSLKNTHFDVIVIGGGPMGLSAAYNCSKAGQKVLVLERFNFFNQSGSSNDLVRMFRTMYSEDFMADLAKESITHWKNFESDAAEQLIMMTGLLNFGDPRYEDGPEGNLMAPIKNLKRLGMSYRVFSAKEIMEEYPFKNLPSNFEGIFAPDNGCINVPGVLRALYRLANGYGAKLVSHTRVDKLNIKKDGVSVEVDTGGKQTSFTARRAIVTSGAYSNQVLGSIGVKLNLNIWEMSYAYYATKPAPNGTLFPSMWFQFLDPTGGDPANSNLLYGFPSVPWGPPNVARIAVDNAVNTIKDPAERLILPASKELEITSAYVEKHCIGVDKRPNYCGTCLQTNVPDNMFILDYLPPSVGQGYKNVAIFTAGWGFKFVPLIGKILKELVVDGQTSHDISHFKITRPGVIGPTKSDWSKIRFY